MQNESRSNFSPDRSLRYTYLIFAWYSRHDISSISVEVQTSQHLKSKIDSCAGDPHKLFKSQVQEVSKDVPFLAVFLYLKRLKGQHLSNVRKLLDSLDLLLMMKEGQESMHSSFITPLPIVPLPCERHTLTHYQSRSDSQNYLFYPYRSYNVFED